MLLLFNVWLCCTLLYLSEQRSPQVHPDLETPFSGSSFPRMFTSWIQHGMFTIHLPCTLQLHQRT
ncbi:hypothetical protein C1I59_03910 [Paenibacillus polymyxa]|nr:hypothetical protein C1I59_03910 [Paenibacillus polymyxa]